MPNRGSCRRCRGGGNLDPRAERAVRFGVRRSLSRTTGAGEVFVAPMAVPDFETPDTSGAVATRDVPFTGQPAAP